MQTLFVYITCANKNEAHKIAKTVVEERLAACANIMLPHQSIYHWEGKVQEAEEVAVILKTTEAAFDKLQARVLELHSYECPCIVALPIDKGYSAYLKWIEGETRG